MAERARLESECVLQSAPRVRIPLSPPNCTKSEQAVKCQSERKTTKIKHLIISNQISLTVFGSQKFATELPSDSPRRGSFIVIS